MNTPHGAGKSSFDLIDPQIVFDELRLKHDTIMIDLACGAGNYTLAAAEHIGLAGAIHAFDLWPDGIAALRESARSRGLSQIRAEVIDVGARMPLPDAIADVALIATALHDLVEGGVGEGALAEAARMLHPGGRLVIIEFDKVESHRGPPAAIRLSPEEVEALVVPFGFRRDRLISVGDPLYLISFVLS